MFLAAWVSFFRSVTLWHCSLAKKGESSRITMSAQGGFMFKKMMSLIQLLAPNYRYISESFGEANMPTSQVGQCGFEKIGRTATVRQWQDFLAGLKPAKQFCHPMALLTAVQANPGLLKSGPVFTVWADARGQLWYLGVGLDGGEVGVFLYRENLDDDWRDNYRAGSSRK